MRLRTSQASKDLKEEQSGQKKKKRKTQQCKGPEVTIPCFRISRGQDAGVRKKKVKDEVGKESELRLSRRGNSPNLYYKDIVLVGHILLTIETEW